MSSLLEDMKSKMNKEASASLSEYDKALRECPPIPARLIAYLDRMFSCKKISPTSPTMQQELVFQAGIETVIQHLRSQNDRQEKDIRETRTKGS